MSPKPKVQSPKLIARNAARFWSAPALWRFSTFDCAAQSGRRLPQSKTLSHGREHLNQS